MEINPQRVRSAEFKTVRKGDDPDEVRVFLNDVADELEQAQNQSTAMEARARAAVARLQELSEAGAPAVETQVREPVEASPDEAETISRTLVLAQRTADTTVAEARTEAARILAVSSDEAAATLDSTREMSALLLAEAREEARSVGQAQRIAIAGEVDALMARRDFLESDVDHLETFLVDQRTRVRDAATSLMEVAERVPGGLGDTRRPLLSASDDETAFDDAVPDDDVVDAEIEQAATALEQTDTEQAAIEQAEIEHDRAEVGDPETGQAESGDAEVRETAMDADDGEAGLDSEIVGIVADITDGEQASNEREGWSQSPATDDGPSDDEFRFSFENEGR
jgi:DivIVA domain-containing protein